VESLSNTNYEAEIDSMVNLTHTFPTSTKLLEQLNVREMPELALSGLRVLTSSKLYSFVSATKMLRQFSVETRSASVVNLALADDF
jgi:hypothetical protein